MIIDDTKYRLCTRYLKRSNEYRYKLNLSNAPFFDQGIYCYEFKL